MFILLNRNWLILSIIVLDLRAIFDSHDASLGKNNFCGNCWAICTTFTLLHYQTEGVRLIRACVQGSEGRMILQSFSKTAAAARRVKNRAKGSVGSSFLGGAARRWVFALSLSHGRVILWSPTKKRRRVWRPKFAGKRKFLKWGTERKGPVILQRLWVRGDA